MADRTIYIGNLNSKITEEDLVTFFSAVGPITRVKMAGDPSYPARFAFVEFAEPEQARAACSFAGTELAGRKIRVSMSNNPIAPSSAHHGASAMQAAAMPFAPQMYGGYPYVAGMVPMGMGAAATYPYVAMAAANPGLTAYNNKQAAKIARTIYVSGIDVHVTEEQLLEFFSYCGNVVNYNICGDANHPTRFGFFEFANANAAMAAVTLSGAMLGTSALRISMSKTAIQTMNPKAAAAHSNQAHREAISKTIYVGNVDMTLTKEDLQQFFESCCGPVSKISLAGDMNHPTRFAFIEFASTESRDTALKLNGTILANRTIRVSPSHTPILSGGGPTTVGGTKEASGSPSLSSSPASADKQEQRQDLAPAAKEGDKKTKDDGNKRKREDDSDDANASDNSSKKYSNSSSSSSIPVYNGETSAQVSKRSNDNDNDKDNDKGDGGDDRDTASSTSTKKPRMGDKSSDQHNGDDNEQVGAAAAEDKS